MMKYAGDTFEFIKDVNFAKERSWFKPSKELVYIITGYGPINSLCIEEVLLKMILVSTVDRRKQ